MAIPNAYPNLPEVPYKATTVDMADVYTYIQQSSTNVNIQRALAFIFINESGWGKNGINNNYCGIQADGDPLGASFDNDVIATTTIVDSTGTDRRFCVFNSWQVNIDYLLNQITNRQIYIGGQTWEYSHINIQTPADLALAYEQEWVLGDPNGNPSQADLTSDENLYEKVCTLLTPPAPTIYEVTDPLMVFPIIGQIETFLKDEKYYDGDIDNTYTEEVASAVANYQMQNDLSVDGKAGPDTLAKMGINV